MNPKIAGVIAIVVIIGGGAFYGGMTYAQMSRGGSGGGNFTNLSPEERQARFAGNGNPGTRGSGGTGGGFTAGEIISKDETSITIKMQDGSTKIVLVSSSAQIMKSAAGTVNDLTVGTQVTITGSANSDGSLTAESVQIRPAGFVPFGGGTRTSQ